MPGCRATLASILLGTMLLAHPGTSNSAATSTQVAPGTIRGRVDLAEVRVTTEARPTAAALGAPARRPVELRPAVVYLDAAPRGAFEPEEAAHATMDQRDQTFVPHVLAITAGTTVDFPNSDVTFHNVFSLSKTRPFDLGRYPRGQSKSLMFDRPGVVQVFCDIHSHMSAYILVFAHHFYAVTDEAGRYAIEGVPPGTYSVIAWYEGKVRDTRRVTVPEGGAVEVDFAVR